MPQRLASTRDRVTTLPKDTLFGGIDSDTLRRYFTLFEADLAEVERCRSEVNKLVVALQLCTLRWRGHFLSHFIDVPGNVIETLSAQLGISDLDLTPYPYYADTIWEHYERIRCHLGFNRCDENKRLRLRENLQEQAAILPRSSVLYALACRWLFEQRIVRPGIVTLRRIVSQVKAKALERAYKTLTRGLSSQQKAQLEKLLEPALQPTRKLDENEDDSTVTT